MPDYNDVGPGPVIGGGKPLDFPYKCRYCGQAVSIKNRHPWNHLCIEIKEVSEKRHPDAHSYTTESIPTKRKYTPYKVIDEDTDYKVIHERTGKSFFAWLKKLLRL